VPGGTTQEHGCPVTAAMRSNSASQWSTATSRASAAAATSRWGIFRPRRLRAASRRWTCSARGTWAAVVSHSCRRARSPPRVDAEVVCRV